mgnify:CR=1 FL=1
MKQLTSITASVMAVSTVRITRGIELTSREMINGPLPFAGVSSNSESIE